MITRLATLLALLCTVILAGNTGVQSAQAPVDISGTWHFNRDLSDSTDRQVEKSLKAAGQKVQRKFFSSDNERYRGGPEEQAMYDHISYDTTLEISRHDDHYLFSYDGYERPVYTDDRERSVSLSNLGEVGDFSLGHWEGETFLVEGHPRDGGFINERYQLIEDGTRLEVELYLKPRVFTQPIEITRIYDRAGATEDS